MKVDHYLHFDTAFQDESFDDPALYEPFVLYGQLELMLNTILYDLCGRNGASSVPDCNNHKMRENKNNFKSAFKFFLRIGTDLYGYRTMKRFKDSSGVAKEMKLAGDKILRPMILNWIDRLKDPKFRSIMDIGGSEGTWNTNPETYLESKQFWADNFNIHYPYRRASEGASSFPPVPIRSTDWISLRCFNYRRTSNPCHHNTYGASCVTEISPYVGGQDSWLSCWGDTKGRSFGEYCKFRRCPHTMAGQNWGTCRGEHFQIESIYRDNTPIKSGQKIGLKYDSNYWLSRYQGSVLKGYGMNMPCPGSTFTRSDTIGCVYETWSISKANGKTNEIIRHGDLVDIPGLNQCFIFKHMF